MESNYLIRPSKKGGNPFRCFSFSAEILVRDSTGGLLHADAYFLMAGWGVTTCCILVADLNFVSLDVFMTCVLT